jgi:hypothetical protein
MSSDYGSTWITSDSSIVNLGSYNKAISPSGKYLLYASTLYPINSGYPITHVYKENTIYFYYSSDYGTTWGFRITHCTQLHSKHFIF